MGLAMQSKERSPKFNKSSYMDAYDDEFSTELPIGKSSEASHGLKKEEHCSAPQEDRERNDEENSLATEETTTDCQDIAKTEDLEYMMENVKLRAVPGKTNESFFGLCDESENTMNKFSFSSPLCLTDGKQEEVHLSDLKGVHSVSEQLKCKEMSPDTCLSNVQRGTTVTSKLEKIVSNDSKSNQNIVENVTCNEKVTIEKQKPINNISSIETAQPKSKIECHALKSSNRRETKASLLRRAQMEEKRNGINSKKKCIAFGTKIPGCLDKK